MAAKSGRDLWEGAFWLCDIVLFDSQAESCTGRLYWAHHPSPMLQESVGILQCFAFRMVPEPVLTLELLLE